MNLRPELLTPKFIKDLHDYLLVNPEYFCSENAVSEISEVMYLKLRNPKNLVFFGEYLLCDIYSNEMWLCEVLGKKIYVSRRLREMSIKPLYFITDNKDNFFHTFNGCWSVPDIDELEWS